MAFQIKQRKFEWHKRPSPFSKERKQYKGKRWEIRVNETILKGKINVIPIDGAGQTGKSTTADAICKKFDEHYFLAYTAKDLVKILKDLKKIWYDGNQAACMNHWFFWDEPQNEIPKQRFWDERLETTRQITSTWGFLKPNLVFALPNVKALNDDIIKNISLRISTEVFLDNKQKRHYWAFFKKPIWLSRKQKYGWSTFQSYEQPFIELPLEYWNRKMENFWHTQLSKWDSMVNYQSKGEMKKFDEDFLWRAFKRSLISKQEYEDKMTTLGFDNVEIQLGIKMKETLDNEKIRREENIKEEARRREEKERLRQEEIERLTKIPTAQYKFSNPEQRDYYLNENGEKIYL